MNAKKPHRWIGRLSAVILAAALVHCGDSRSQGPDPCEGIDCSGHGECRSFGGEAQCICDTGWVVHQSVFCIPEGCTPECTEGERQCLDDVRYEICRTVQDCPVWEEESCGTDMECINGNCFPMDVPTCQQGNNPSADVAEPQYVHHVTAPQVWTGWFSSPAVYDLDGDGEMEIINAFYIDGNSVTTDTSYFTQRGGDYPDAPLDWGQFIRWVDPQVEEDHYHLHTGTWPHPDWTYWAQWTHSPPIVVDIDGDGNNEVVGIPNAEMNVPYETHFHAPMVLDGDYASEGNRSGRRMPGWETMPRTDAPLWTDWDPPGVIPAVTAANVLGDDRPELLASISDGYIYCWSPDAAELWRYDYAAGAQLGGSEPVVADVR